MSVSGGDMRVCSLELSVQHENKCSTLLCRRDAQRHHCGLEYACASQRKSRVALVAGGKCDVVVMLFCFLVTKKKCEQRVQMSAPRHFCASFRSVVQGKLSLLIGSSLGGS